MVTFALGTTFVGTQVSEGWQQQCSAGLTSAFGWGGESREIHPRIPLCWCRQSDWCDSVLQRGLSTDVFPVQLEEEQELVPHFWELLVASQCQSLDFASRFHRRFPRGSAVQNNKHKTDIALFGFWIFYFQENFFPWLGPGTAHFARRKCLKES